MKNIKRKIHLLIFVSMLIVATVISYIIVNRTIQTYNKEAEEMLLAEVINESNYFNEQLLDVEKTATAIEVVVEALFDVEKYKDQGYLENLKDILAPAIKKITVETSESKSGYIYFYHQLLNEPHDIWYSSIGGEGSVVRQPEIQMDYYSEYTEAKEWYFNPVLKKKNNWTNPFSGNLDYTKDLIFVSYTKPVVKDDLLIGVAGSDYMLNNMLEYILTIEIKNKGYAILLDGDYNIVVDGNNDQTNQLEFWTKQKMTYRDNGIIDYDQNYLLAFNTLRNGWTFGFFIEKDDLIHWYHEVRNIMVILILSTLFFGYYLSKGLADYLINPLERLIVSINAIGEGNYDIAIDDHVLNKKDEIGYLAGRVDALRNTLLNTFDTIHEQNVKLSETVNKRTQSLHESHLILEKSLEVNKMKNQELMDLNQSLEYAIENMGQTQQSLIEKEKAASLSVIVAKMAHEFNTPIGSFLTLFTYLNKKRLVLETSLNNKSLKKTDLQAFLKHYDSSQVMIMDAHDAIRSLVDRFKGLDHYTSNKIVSKINIKEFIGLIIDESITYGYLDVILNCPSNLNLFIDAGKFSQIILQIVENAYLHAYHSEKGQVKIDVSYEDKLAITITDYGRGIPEHLISEIFVPFYSEFLSNRTSGLGLNLVYNLVTQVFNGQIQCESKENVFTRFDIELEV